MPLVLARWAGNIFCGMSCLALSLTLTAAPAVLDVPMLSLCLAAFGICLSVLVFLLRKRSTLPWFSAAMLTAALLAGSTSAYIKYFSVREVQAYFTDGEVRLSGTVVLPTTPGPHPAVVFVHGSGRESRREYLYYARRLARSGIAALAYDKRGVGNSTGSLYDSDYSDYARDVEAALRFLRAQPGIDRNAVGLVAYSEGEWTAPLAALRDGHVAFLAVIGASGLTPAQQVNAEIAMRLTSRGHSREDVTRALALNNSVFNYERSGQGAAELQRSLSASANEGWFADAEDIPSEVSSIEDYSWWRSVMDFDPRPLWQQVSAPVLLLKGARDNHSPVANAREEITNALLRGGRPPPDFVTFPDADHTLLVWPLGNRVPPPLFANGYFDVLIGWIKRKSVPARSTLSTVPK